jgi:hypothetical protein
MKKHESGNGARAERRSEAEALGWRSRYHAIREYAEVPSYHAREACESCFVFAKIGSNGVQ